MARAQRPVVAEAGQEDQPEETLARVAAIDVAKNAGMVCTRLPHDTRAGRKVQKVWEVAARHDDILALADHLRCHGVERVVVESTSDYWRIWLYLLEAAGLRVWLVNARDVKNAPGRPKSDKLDAVCLCKLNERGMLRPSFVPPAEIRDLRQLTRLRAKLGQDATRHRNRIKKILEDALLIIFSVLSDLFGASGRRILQALVAGQNDPARLADLADSRVRASKAELRAALTGRFRQVHAVESGMLLQVIDLLEAKVAELDEAIAAMVAALPAAAPACGRCALVGGEHAPTCPDTGVLLPGLAGRLDEITGVGTSCAQVIIAELGTDVTGQFPTPGHAAAWAKLVPIIHQSGRISRSGPTGKGNRWLRGALGTAAMAAAKSKGTFLGERYQRIRRRRDKQKALIAIARTILEIAYRLIADPTLRFHDLGAEYYDTLNPEKRTHSKIRELERLNPGMKVTLTPIDTLTA